MRLALEKALRVRVRLTLLKTHVGSTDNQCCNFNKCDHFTNFSMILSALRRAGMVMHLHFNVTDDYLFRRHA